MLRRFRPGLHFFTEPIRESKGVLFVLVGAFVFWGVCGLKSGGYVSEGSGVLERSLVSGGVGETRSSSSITVPPIGGGRDFFRKRRLSRLGVFAGRPANLRADVETPVGLRATMDVAE